VPIFTQKISVWCPRFTNPASTELGEVNSLQMARSTVE
jgi:hypothetical protein